MSRKNMDDIFRDGLKNYSSEIDPNEIWSGIQAKKPGPDSDDEDRRRPFAWWIIGAMLLVAAGSFMMFTYQADTSINSETALGKMNLMNTSMTPNSNNERTSPEATNNTDSTIDDKTDTENIMNATPELVSENTTIEKTITDIKKKVTDLKSTSKTVSTKINQTNKNTNTKKQTQTSSNDKTIIEMPANNSWERNNMQASDFPKTNSNTTSNKAINPVAEKPTKGDLNKIVLLDLLQSNEVIPIVSTTQEEAPEETPIPDMSVSDIPEGCYGSPAFSFGIGAHVAPDLVFHKITSTEQEFFPYIDERLRTEKLLESYHGGLDVYFQHRDGFTLRSGVEYAQINKRFTFEESWMVTNPDMDIDTTYTRIKKTTNRYRMIDVPLTVGYDINIPNWDISIFIEAGVSMNVLFAKKGDILGPEPSGPGFEPVTFTDGASERLDSYVDNVGLSFLGGVGVRYELRDGMFLYAQPAGKIYLNSFTKKDYPINEKFSRIGLNLGVMYKL